MKIEGSFRDPFEFDQSEFRKCPKRFNSIDMSVSSCEFIDSMMYYKMLRISHVDKPLILSLSITMNHSFQFNMTPYNLLQTSFTGIGNDLSVDPAVALKDAENIRFRSCYASPFSANSLGTKARFINTSYDSTLISKTSI